MTAIWQPYPPIYTASPYFKNSYIKNLISLQPCHISYNLSQGAFRRSKYSSGVFSINFPHSDLLSTVLTANLFRGLFMGLIEQGVVSNGQFNSHITYLFIYLFIQNYLDSVLWCSFLISAAAKF